MTKFSKMLIDERKKKNLKKGEVALQLGVVSDYYCKVEKGYIIPKTDAALLKYANFLNISLDDLKDIIKNNKEND